MKKPIIILALCALQGACAQYDHRTAERAPLLSFAELGAEISVTRIAVDADEAATPVYEDVIAGR